MSTKSKDKEQSTTKKQKKNKLGNTVDSEKNKLKKKGNRKQDQSKKPKVVQKEKDESKKVESKQKEEERDHSQKNSRPVYGLSSSLAPKKEEEAQIPPKDPRERFEQFIRDDEHNTWPDLEKFAKKIGEQEGTNPEEIMKQLISARDDIDDDMYEDAAKNLFPTTKFITQSVRKYKLNSKEETLFRYYVLTICDKKGAKRDQDPNLPSCQIAIKAPGSRTLTSDIDTTLSVTGVENLTLSNSPLLELKQPKGDPRLLVQALMIEQFHRLSDSKKYGSMTSAMSRDSNVYSDGFLREAEEKKGEKVSDVYPKFHDNPKIREEPFLDDRLTFYAKAKKEKHYLELAASLVPFRQEVLSPPILSEAEWANFRGDLEKQLVEFGFSEEQIGLIKDDFLIVCQKVETLCQYGHERMEAEFKKQVSKRPNRANLKKEIFEKDCRIAALNVCYVKHLKDIALLEADLSKAPKEITSLVEERKNLSRELDVLEEEFGVLSRSDHFNNKSSPRYSEKYTKMKSEAFTQSQASIKEALKVGKEALEKVLTRVANLQVERQEAQIKANLFAYEAYVNYSASYHVVSGIQSGETIKQTKHTVMGSALQQIGFKLLHTQQMEKEKRERGQIAYKTAKYGQRVAHLVFGQLEPIEDKTLKRICYGRVDVLKKEGEESKQKSNKVLSALKDKDFHVYFTSEEYTLLNREMGIVQKIKSTKDKDKEIPESQKATETAKQFKLGDTRKEKQSWLQIGTKIIVAGYEARLKKKGGLWGSTFFNSSRRLSEKDELFVSTRPPEKKTTPL